MRITSDGTVFLPLPAAMRRPIIFGCNCPFCKAHPNETPSWDTLAGHPDQRWTWTVHFPEVAYGVDDG